MRLAANFIVCGTCWVILTGGDPESLVIGIPVTLVAGILMTALAEKGTRGLSLLAGIAFAGYFVRASVTAGFDVARRVCVPRIKVSPAFIAFESQLHSQQARVFFANAVSLIPGTLSAGYEGSTLRVHVLDDGQDNVSDLRSLESHVARIFREPNRLEA
jgi:multicomponent Na+:H+ antiporter subunit E